MWLIFSIIHHFGMKPPPINKYFKSRVDNFHVSWGAHIFHLWNVASPPECKTGEEKCDQIAPPSLKGRRGLVNSRVFKCGPPSTCPSLLLSFFSLLREIPLSYLIDADLLEFLFSGRQRGWSRVGGHVLLVTAEWDIFLWPNRGTDVAATHWFSCKYEERWLAR